MSNYEEIIKNNLQRLYGRLPEDLAKKLPARRADDNFLFSAFGDSCRLGPQGIILGNRAESGPIGIVISLYALQASIDSCQLTPFKAFRELPDSMPYVGAFTSHAEGVLVDQIDNIESKTQRIVHQFQGSRQASHGAGDFSFIVYPLPKIALNYIFYLADDDFPASVTCLFSHNAAIFLPTDALADTGEYTSQKILDML